MPFLFLSKNCALRRIGNEAFRECPMNEIEIPAGVEELGERCFMKSYLSRVIFASGSALKRMGKSAFRECDKLREIPASRKLARTASMDALLCRGAFDLEINSAAVINTEFYVSFDIVFGQFGR